MYFITSDCAALCFDCADKEQEQITDSIREHSNDGWRIVAVEINYEDGSLYCDHCNKTIECASCKEETDV